MINRPRTDAIVEWNNIDDVYGTEKEFSSPNISTIIQEIVDRNGWLEGNSITLFLTDNASDTGQWKEIFDSCPDPTRFGFFTQG